ncbi:MAG: hypothetical protein J7577_02050 [Sphingobacteriaceae bacterium]|nr:hypothetical protein [Sphingobacteriaceae bacterium]
MTLQQRIEANGLESINANFKTFENLLFDFINQDVQELNNELKQDANIILQMIFTKVVTLHKSFEGISFETQEYKLNNILDPVVIASISRTIYEAIGFFHLLYIYHQDEKTELIHKLWISSGLKYRQKFSGVLSNEGKDKLLKEKSSIDNIRLSIENLAVYKKASPKNKKVIIDNLTSKEFKLDLNNAKFKKITFTDLLSYMEYKPSFYPDLYSLFSLNSHPSYISLIQFRDMFSADQPAFKSLAEHYAHICFYLLGVFVKDYLQIFPSCKSRFDKLSDVEQKFINFCSTFFRGEKYAIKNFE